MPSMSDMDERHAEMLRALGHPVRLGIMRRLSREPEICACDFTESFGLRQPTVSQHLKVLREAALVITRRRGTQICYSVHPEALDDLATLLRGLGHRDPVTAMRQITP